MLTQAPNSSYKFCCFDSNSLLSVILAPKGEWFCRFFSKIHYPLISILFLQEKLILSFILFCLIFSVEL